MPIKIYLRLAVCLILIQATGAYGALLCSNTLTTTATVSLKSINAAIQTPESLKTVEQAVQKIKSILDGAQNNQPGALNSIYKKALPEVLKAYELGQKIIRNKSTSQNEVFEFFYKFSQVIDLPKNFVRLMSNQIDGLRGLDQFTEIEFETRLKLFKEHYKSEEPLLDHAIKELQKPIRFNLSSSFKYITINDKTLADDLKFSFQYKYIFNEGYFSLRELFQDRESGTVFLGVSFSDHAIYDGQHGNAVAFLKHDVLHAYTQKYYDMLLFEEFHADTTTKKISLKTKTNALLQSRVQELSQIQDKDLMAAIDVVYFTLLHEQSLSYPLGIENELRASEKVTSWKKRIFSGTQGGYFGQEHVSLPEGSLSKALSWVHTRALSDAQTLKKQLAP